MWVIVVVDICRLVLHLGFISWFTLSPDNDITSYDRSHSSFDLSSPFTPRMAGTASTKTAIITGASSGIQLHYFFCAL